MAKLTLSVDERVVSRAKLYAKQHGASVSELVESYLAALAQSSEDESATPPVLKSLRGILRSGDREEYRRHLIEKYK